jgi:hypothetical protein
MVEPEGSGPTSDSLEEALERLQTLVIQTMDSLAEQVLGQIQTTRGIAEQTDMLIRQLHVVTADPPAGDASESHRRHGRDQGEATLVRG